MASDEVKVGDEVRIVFPAGAEEKDVEVAVDGVVQCILDSGFVEVVECAAYSIWGHSGVQRGKVHRVPNGDLKPHKLAGYARKWYRENAAPIEA